MTTQVPEHFRIKDEKIISAEEQAHADRDRVTQIEEEITRQAASLSR
jgi:hypothetical protein